MNADLEKHIQIIFIKWYELLDSEEKGTVVEGSLDHKLLQTLPWAIRKLAPSLTTEQLSACNRLAHVHLKQMKAGGSKG